MADWSDIEHAAGDTDYIAHLNTLVSRSQAVATEVETARGGAANLDARLDGLLDASAGLPADLAANGHKITGLADPVNGQDAATKAWANALLVGGGSPASIPITGLGAGAATASQLVRINGAGTAPEGVSPSGLAVTGFGVGGLSALQLLRANGAGTALEGVSPSGLAVTGFGVGGLSALQLLRANGAGTALEGYTLSVPAFSQKSKSGAYTAVAADSGVLLRLTGTWTLAFQAAATLADGWWAYLSNEGSGDIALDPNGAETIDGLASFVMYPGEARLVFCTGTALKSLVLSPFYREFASSGTFTKPPGYRQFAGMIWGGGGSGGRNLSSKIAGGGGGGGCTPFAVPAAAVGTTETVTVGAGGAAVANPSYTDGNAGGNSSFGTLVVGYGGGAGGGNAGTTDCSTGGGGGVLSAGTLTAGGEPAGATVATDQKGFGGAIGGGVAGEGVTIYGGGWKTLFGGGSGGRGASSNSAGGSSVLGGAGGAGLFASGGSNASNGAAPGGGGGGRSYSTTYTGSSGAGAAGALRIWGVA